MSLRYRPTGAAVLAMVLVAAPAASVAAPGGEPGRAALPPAAYNAEILAPAAATAGPDRDVASSAAPTDTTAPPPYRTLAAAEGVSTYVDDCEGASGDAHDARRLQMATDSGYTLLTMRTCDPAALADFGEQTLTWTTTTTRAGQAEHVVEVTGPPMAEGRLQLRIDGDAVTDSASGAWVEQPETGIWRVFVQFPGDELGLQDSWCAPTTGVACLQFRFDSLPSGSGDADTLPNAGARAPLWPSRCGADVDPASVGHVRLTTSSSATAGEVERALHEAGYRADAHPDAPYVEVPVGASSEVVDVLERWEEVVEVTPVSTRRMSAEPDDDQYDRQWYLPHIGMESAWDVTTGSSNIGIAIVDNGVAADRPDLAGRVAAGWDGMVGTALPGDVHSDLGGHGTAVAGIAAGSAGNDGIVGVDWRADVHPVRVFDHEGCFVSEANYLEALDWIAREAGQNRIHVANFSLGGGAIPGEATRIQRIVDNGAAVVAAMGNMDRVAGAGDSYPAALPEVLAVGATGPDDARALYSQQGRHLDVVAPGGDLSGSPSGDLWVLADPTLVGADEPFEAQAGTSFSSPLVAGLAGLYRATYPTSTPADFARALLTTARDLGDDLAGFDVSYGFGMVDAAAVLAHEPGQTLQRLAGGDRYETAAEISRRAFPERDLVDTVLLATGQDYPDALAGGPLAAREHAPLLLTPRDELHDATEAEIRRLDPERVLLLGGTSVLTANVEAELQAMGVLVERAAGGDRFATAKAIALGSAGSSWRAWNTSDVVFLATGENFPDALPGGAAAAAADAPLLLTNRTRLPGPTREALGALRPSRVIALGGPTAIDDAVLAEVASLGIRVGRAQGGDRYETAIAALCPTADLCQADTRFALVATGESFADALGGSAGAAALRAPLLLVPSSGSIPAVLREAMEVVAPEQMIVLGGQIPIPDAVASQVRELAVD